MLIIRLLTAILVAASIQFGTAYILVRGTSDGWFGELSFPGYLGVMLTPLGLGLLILPVFVAIVFFAIGGCFRHDKQ